MLMRMFARRAVRGMARGTTRGPRQTGGAPMTQAERKAARQVRQATRIARRLGR
jgi:hypothetical protein